MSSVECLREFVNQRLSAAAEEIFGVFKRTIVEYQEEIERQRGMLDVILRPEVRLHRIELPQSRVCKQEEFLSDQQLCLQERNPSVDQEDPDPPQIKEEQEKLCSSPEGEQLEPKQEADTFTLTPTCEETDHSDDETPFFNPDKSQSESEAEPPASTCTSSLDEEMDCERFVGPEPNISHESDSEDQKGVKRSLTSTKESQQQILAPPEEKTFSCKTCGKDFKYSKTLKVHMEVQTEKRLYSCNTCGKTFAHASSLKSHTRIHTGEKPYSCITCGKTFTDASGLKNHTRIHTGDKPYSCLTCGKTFTQPAGRQPVLRLGMSRSGATGSTPR
ncbi:zinc finger protein with KRAB and SCAN domains 3-like [Pungitius pungitius]|uniref:zinc finger protein with KRAB and SCAN domains 3-like n=1 Tax=Pungitius pungitius TaxID=134920 RepID=UPI002E139013